MTDAVDILADRIDALESELRDLRDERAIRELLALYGYLADSKEIEKWLELWTDDGVMDLSMGHSALEAEAFEHPQRWEGKDALRDFINDPTAYKKPGFYGRVMHLQGNNVQVRIDGDEAEVTAYSVVLHSAEGGPTTVLGAGSNRWTFRREQGHWRIRSRIRRPNGDPEFGATLRVTP